MAANFVQTAVWQDAHALTARKVPQQARPRLLQMEDHCVIIRSVDVIDETIRSGLAAANFSLQQGIEAPLHITRGERASVAEFDAVVQVKDISCRVGNVPVLGQAGFYAQVLVASEKIIEEQSVNVL